MPKRGGRSAGELSWPKVPAGGIHCLKKEKTPQSTAGLLWKHWLILSTPLGSEEYLLRLLGTWCSLVKCSQKIKKPRDLGSSCWVGPAASSAAPSWVLSLGKSSAGTTLGKGRRERIWLMEFLDLNKTWGFSLWCWCHPQRCKNRSSAGSLFSPSSNYTKVLV